MTPKFHDVWKTGTPERLAGRGSDDEGPERVISSRGPGTDGPPETDPTRMADLPGTESADEPSEEENVYKRVLSGKVTQTVTGSGAVVRLGTVERVG